MHAKFSLLFWHAIERHFQPLHAKCYSPRRRITYTPRRPAAAAAAANNNSDLLRRLSDSGPPEQLSAAHYAVVLLSAKLHLAPTAAL